MNPTKVAMIVPSFCVAGAETMAAQLAAYVDRTRFDLSLLVMSSDLGTSLDRYIAESGVNVTYFNKPAGFSLSVMLRISRFLNDFQPDVIHTHLSAWIYALPWAMLRNIRIIHTVHSMPQHECAGILAKIRRRLHRNGKIIPVGISDSITRDLLSYYSLSAERVETVFNPVDIRKFSAGNRQPRSGEPLTFINVARFSPVKNQALLVEAFARVHMRIPHTRLLLLGDGELRIHVEEKVRELELEDVVRFTGNIPYVRDMLLQSDIFVLSSDYEGLPMTILEAMAAGLPIIATNVGGVPDIVKENGILIEYPEVDSLANAMVCLAEDAELRLKMGRISSLMAEQYDIRKVTAQYEALYEKYAGPR